MIQKHLTAKKTNNYVNILQKLLNDYNHKNHSTIKMSPFDASKPENEDKVRKVFTTRTGCAGKQAC